MPKSPGPTLLEPPGQLPVVLVPDCNNFVERPWGGLRMRAYKGLCALPEQPRIGGAGLGEAFEIAAWDTDPEARAHPSRVALGGGRRATLSALLEAHGEALLGPAFVRQHGRAYPLLPKTLDILELLSVQGHPPGHTEAYLVIDADPGATIRLGCAVDQDPRALRAALHEGRQAQQRLLEYLLPDVGVQRLQAVLAPWFARPASPAADLAGALEPALARSADWARLRPELEALKRLYWQVLESLNAIPVVPGQVIYNANPARIVAATGRAAAAEIHALGNPEGREILMLEIRRPGPTLRAWDNLRFPLRPLDIDAALAALNLTRTAPEEFLVEPRPDPVRAGVWHSVDCEYFRIEHLRPRPGCDITVTSDWPHTLHTIRGRAVLEPVAPERAGVPLVQGQSALVGIELARYRLTSPVDGTEVVRVELPRGG